jgi:hypothetical protein
MAQMGQTDASFTLSTYARVMERRDGEAEKLAALVGDRGKNGQRDASRGTARAAHRGRRGVRIGTVMEDSTDGRDGLQSQSLRRF